MTVLQLICLDISHISFNLLLHICYHTSKTPNTSFIHDTPTLPPDAFLVTADVSSLYTNIPHDEGISAVLHYINTHRQHMPANTPPDYIFEIILRHILDHSFFQFIDTVYHQITGTSMGTRMAPPYANLFMGRVEHKILQCFHTFITIWKRFIDDIFFIFTGTLEQLTHLINYMNALHPTIKFTFEHSQISIPFLDTHIYIDENRKLQSTLYCKPTDRMFLLHYHSHHPAHCKESIIYTQAPDTA